MFQSIAKSISFSTLDAFLTTEEGLRELNFIIKGIGTVSALYR